MGTTEEYIDYPRGLTFESVWAAIMESRKEADRRMEKLEEQVEKTSKIVGGLGNSIGLMKQGRLPILTYCFPMMSGPWLLK